MNTQTRCQRQKRRLTQEMAVNVALTLGYPEVPYFCKPCGSWHAGADRGNPKRFWNRRTRAQYMRNQAYKKEDTHDQHNSTAS